MERQSIHLSLGGRDSSRILSLVELGFDPKSSTRSGIAYQVDDGLEGAQRLTSPVLGDVAEQALQI